MLLMGCNGLFERPQNDSAKLIATMKTINPPDSSEKLDQFYKAQQLTVSNFSCFEYLIS
jgi:hypothetical protein